MTPTTAAERSRAEGRAARTRVPRGAHGEFRCPDRDPVAIFEQQNRTRLPELVPIRYERMTESPFAYYRGSAAAMAADLSTEAVTGPHVVASGDAHLANFGLYASPERRVLFDLNDFDEAYPAPWEWDVKRLAASVWLAGRHTGCTEQQCRDATLATVCSYRETIRFLSGLTATERFYFQVDAEEIEQASRNPEAIRAVVQKARSRTSEQVLRKLTVTTADGVPRIVDQPPIVRHLDIGSLDAIERIVASYRATVRADAQLLLSQYRVVDFAMRIVGVGSVGTRCFLVLLLGPADEPLFLQVKEAGRSVLETHGGIRETPHRVEADLIAHGQGARVVGAQRILQAHSDPLLGWITGVPGADGVRRDFYVRQFRDMKGSVQWERLRPAQSEQYGRLCGALLARAHSQSPDGAFVAGYLGRGTVFDEAVARWSAAYADRTEQDWKALCTSAAPA